MKIKFLIAALLIPFCFSCTKTEKNTETTSIADLSEQEIINKNSSSSIGYFSTTSNNKSTIKVRRFSGAEILKTFNSSKDQIELTLSNTLSEGELRIILCDSEKIIYEFETNKENQTYTIPASNSKVNLKVVGEKAKYTLVYTCESKESQLPIFEGTAL